MTKREIAEMLTAMQANYPDTARGQSDAAFKSKVALWHEFFQGHPKELVHAAATSFIANDTKGFMPNIGQINDYIQKLRCQDDLTEGEAWSYVAKAIRNSIYNAAEEFAKLPERIQRLVGSHNQLREWALMDAEIVQSVVSSNFQRTFRARQKSDAEYERLPGDVKQFVQRMSGEVFKLMPGVPQYALEEGDYD